MRKSCKLGALVTSVLMGFSIQGVGLMATDATFGDVPSGHANAEAIDYVRSHNIVEGYADGTFGPDRFVNRAELVKIIIGAQFAPDPIDECKKNNTKPGWTYMFFTDVPIDAWFSKYICLGKVNGILAGYPDGTFRPDQKVNFAEASKIMSKWLRVETSDEPIWYKPLVDKLGEKNAIPPTITAFDQSLTRGEMAEMVYRLKSNVTTKESSDYESIRAHSGEWRTVRSVKYGFEMRAPVGWGNQAERLPERIDFSQAESGVASNGCGLVQASVNEQDVMKWYKEFYRIQKAGAQANGSLFTLASPELFGATTFNGFAAIEADGVIDGKKQLTVVYLTHKNDIYSCDYPNSDPEDSHFGSHKGLYEKVASTFRFVQGNGVEWKTLANAQYGYTLGYPSDWIIKTTYAEKGFTPRGLGENRDYIGGEVSWKSPEGSQLNLAVYQIKPDMAYDKFIGVHDLKSGDKRDIRINGVGAVRLVWANPDGKTTARSMTLVKKDDKMFVFDLTDNGSISPSEKATAEKLVESFRLQASKPNGAMASADDWKIYQNEAQGYSVAHPPTLELNETNDSYFSQKVVFAPSGDANSLAQVGLLSAAPADYLDSFGKNQNLKKLREENEVPVGEFSGTKTIYQNLSTNEVFSIYILNLEKRSFSMTADPSIEDWFVASFKLTAPKECTDPPTSTDNGREVYPVAEKYSKLQFLGELFTAADCNPERLGKIFGVDGDSYTLGSSLRLNKNPSPELVTSLKDIGYACKEINDEGVCRYWSLDKTAKIDDLRNLIPYLDFFESNDCVNCG